jgi:bacteriocin-like protein
MTRPGWVESERPLVFQLKDLRMKNATTMENSASSRIFARQMARELSHDEMNQVSGGMSLSPYSWCISFKPSWGGLEWFYSVDDS